MDSKYHYLLWRPVTAIRSADLDDNSGNDGRRGVVAADHDPQPSGVSERARMCQLRRRAGARLRGQIAGDRHRRARSDRRRNDVDHLSTSTPDDLLKNVADARVWAGLHYRFSTTAGVNLGAQVGQYDLKGNFLPTKK